MEVAEFYNNISKEYTDILDRTIPGYREMLTTMIRYIPNDFAPIKILELGSGTGNLTEFIIDKYPNSQLSLVDISKDMLAECKVRFKNYSSIKYYQIDFKDLDFKENSFDLVISSIAIHHLEDTDKQILFKKLYSFLKPGGIFTYADQCKGITNEIYQKHIEAWKTEAFKLGSTKENWKTWMEHQEKHDFHATIKEQIQWIENAKFIKIDLLWRNLLWSVFYAEKNT